MPKLLKAPPGHASVCVNGNQYNVRSGHIEVSDGDVAAVLAHDPGFTLLADSDVDRLVVEAEAKTATDQEVLGRDALFARLKELGVVVNRTTKTEVLREILATEVSKAEAKAEEDAKATGETKPAA